MKTLDFNWTRNKSFGQHNQFGTKTNELLENKLRLPKGKMDGGGIN